MMATTTGIDIENLKAQFEEKGYVILREILEPEVVDGVRCEMERLVESHAQKLLASSAISDPLNGEPFETRLYRLYQNDLPNAPRIFRKELHLRGMFSMFFHPHLLDIVEGILGPELRLYPNYSVRPKFPDWAGHQVLWHQDGGYTEFKQESGGQVAALRMVNLWTPLVPVNIQNGCMQFIPATHTIGAVPHERQEHYLEIAEEHLKSRLSEAVDIILDPGDVVLFHNMLFHQGLPNKSNTIRWSCDWRYQDATQSTLRAAQGHMARSRNAPERTVQNAEEWASLSFA